MSELIKEYRKRQRRFKSMGYDIVKERKEILKNARLGSGKILDLGTGHGYMAVELARARIYCVSIDTESKVIRQAREYLKHLGLAERVKLKKADAAALPFKDRSFSTVISVNLLHHLQQPKKCLREMMRVASKKIVIADLNKRGFHILDKIHAEKGSRHHQPRCSLAEAKAYLQKQHWKVKQYRQHCQTVLVCEKGEEK